MSMTTGRPTSGRRWPATAGRRPQSAGAARRSEIGGRVCPAPLDHECEGYQWYDRHRPILLLAWRDLSPRERATWNGDAVQ